MELEEIFRDELEIVPLTVRHKDVMSFEIYLNRR